MKMFDRFKKAIKTAGLSVVGVGRENGDNLSLERPIPPPLFPLGDVSLIGRGDL